MFYPGSQTPPIVSPSYLVWLVALLSLWLCSCGSDGGGPTPVAAQLTEAQNAEGNYISWQENLIDDEFNSGSVPLRGGDGLQMADLDNDGLLDIVSAHEDSDHLRVAYASEKGPHDWFRLSLAEGPEVDAVEDVALGDVNGDGFTDIIAACERGHLIYLQNPANKVRGWRFERVIPTVTRGRGSFIRVFLADLNGDGDLEVIATNKGSGANEKGDKATAISWLEPPDDPLDADGWTEHVLASVKVPINAQPVDLDGDGDMDVFAGSRGEERIFWFENQGADEDGALTFAEHAVEVEYSAGEETLITGFNLAFHDFNSDGRMDVVLAAPVRHSVGWIENPADPAQPWKLHPIGSIKPDHVTGITLADITGNGQPDLMVGGYSRGPRDEDGPGVTVNDPVGRITWFENPGSPDGAWARHDVSRRKRGMFDAFIATDLDDDGDTDFVATRGNSGEFDGVFWLQQLYSEAPANRFTPAREEESESLSLPDEP